MLSMLKEYTGNVEINGVQYSSISDAIAHYTARSGAVNIRLLAKHETTRESISDAENGTLKKITVKPYMTRKATPEFDFMEKFNNNVPMPYRTMIGTVEKETARMQYMKLHADITEERTMRCMCCGRILTNPVSQYFGIGPECGGHNYVHPFFSDAELRKAVAEYRKQLRNVTWEGWVIKSAILEEEEIEDGQE